MDHFQAFSTDFENSHLLGKKWGLTEDQIQKCFLEAVGIKPNKQETRPSTLRKVFRVIFWISVVLVLLFVGMYILVEVHEPTEHFLSRNLADLNHPLFRVVRLAGLPFLNRFKSVEGFYEEACIVNNPMYREGIQSCYTCEMVDTVKTFQNMTADYYDYHFEGTPDIFAVTGLLNEPVPYGRLQKTYENNNNQLGSTSYFASTTDNFTSMADVLTNTAERLQADLAMDKMHIHGYYRKVASAHVLRKLFPRPSFIPAAAEVSLEKSLFIDGARAKLYPLPQGMFHNVWYSQGSGSRRLRFYPAGDCLSECSIFEHIVEEGDTMHWSDHIWRVESLPVRTEYELSVSFVGHYT